MDSLKNLDIILASDASWRSDILNQLNIPHRCIKHRYQEPVFKKGELTDFVMDLAKAKAQSLMDLFPSSMIIAADQLIALDGEVFQKPGTKEKAVSQLAMLVGKKHKLVCAVAVLYKNKIRKEYEEAYLHMRDLSAEEIRYYVEYDLPLNCAGSYKIESLGASLFHEIEVKDPTTIIGLPGNLLLNILRDWGFSNLV